MKDREDLKTAIRVSMTTIVMNVVLSLLKLLAGLFGRSMAMISDAVHSLSDVFSTIIVIIGIKLSKKEADAEHPYGHERLECLATLGLAAILVFTGGVLVYEAGKTIVLNEEIATPSIMALIAAIVSIVVKEGMYWYTLLAAKKINSDALKADAWHHRSDAMSSIGSLIGIGGAMLGYKILDPLAGAVIGIVIFKVAYDIAKEAVDKMIDKACDDEVIESMSQTVKAVEGVIELDLIKTRIFGTRMYVDIEISADEELSLKDSHIIAENVHNTIESEFTDVKHCTVHVNPAVAKK